jgi:predicted cation transporter
MYIALIIILVLIFSLPLISEKVEGDIEIFLFVMGVLASITTGILNVEFITHLLKNHFMYIIAFAVFAGSIIFNLINSHLQKGVKALLNHISLRVFVFLLIVILGFLSSVITAIVASLLLVEIVEMLPASRKNKINITIIACFSIGMGAVLTPIGEPLSTIVVSRLNVDFWYLLTHLSKYVVPGVIGLGIVGSFYGQMDTEVIEEVEIKNQSMKEIMYRTGKIFIFIMALEMIGSGFKPIVDNYILPLNGQFLYWINMSSAVLDNATLAAAEISIKMSQQTINAVLIGLLVSGGMMIPGNIPNIISAGKLKIKSKEWMKLGIPLGLSLLVIYYVVLFVI